MPGQDRDDDPVEGFGNGRRPPDAGVAALQVALLPAGVPILPRIAVGAAYLLGDTGSTGGGDWYDTVVRPDGSLGLVVGDVVGHGILASAAMAQLRAVARHCLGSSESPAAVLTALDRFARGVDAAHTATVCVAVLDSATGALHFSTAGHPPPLLITAGGPRYLTSPPGGAPLATGATYPEATTWMAEGDLLLLYTDGVIRRIAGHPVQAHAELANAAYAAVQESALDDLPGPQQVCDQVIAQLIRGGGHRDDVSMLAAQRHAPVGEVELSLPDTPLAVTTTRAALDAWLSTLRVDESTVTAIQHAVGEAVTNAVEHAYPDRPYGAHAVHVCAELTRSGAAQITVADRGRWREPTTEPYQGMGLTMANELVDDVRIERRDAGTTVRLRHRLYHAVTILGPQDVPGIAVAADEEPFVAALTAVDDLDAVLVVSGPVDAVGAAQLRDQLRSVTGNGTVSRTVDLSRVTLLTSAAVHVLHEARVRSTAHHEHLRLLAPRGSAAHHVLELVGLSPADRL